MWKAAMVLMMSIFMVSAASAKRPSITLAKDTLMLEPYDSLIPGVTALDSLGDTLAVHQEGVFDSSILGTYRIKYYAQDRWGNTSDTVMLTVIVADRIPPTILLNGSKDIYLRQGQTYIEPGYVIIDNFDALPEEIIEGSYRNSLTPGLYTRTYQAKDFSGNISKVLTRFIHVSDTSVGIELFPAPSYELKVYPNPAREQLTIDLASISPGELCSLGLYDLAGRKVLPLSEGMLPSDRLSISLGTIPAGCYFINGVLGDRAVHAKVVRE